MDSATTPTQLAAHRVFVYHEPDNRTEYVSDAVERCDRQRAAVNASLREGSERT